jgi:hypothetical protein
MRRSIATALALVVRSSLTLTLPLPVARADRRDAGQTENPAPTATETSPPQPTYTPPPPVVVAPTVTANGTVIVNPPPTVTAVTAAPPPAYGTQGTIVTPNAVPVVVRNEVSTEHRLLTVEGLVLGTCPRTVPGQSCTFMIPPGTYYLESGETEERRAGRKKIVVAGPTMIDVTPGSKSKRTTGLVIGSVGIGLFFVGFFGTVFVAAHNASVDQDCEFWGDCSGEKTSIAPYVLSLIAGAAGTTIGTIMFATSGTKMKTSTYAPGVSVSLAPIPVRSGSALGLSFAF